MNFNQESTRRYFLEYLRRNSDKTVRGIQSYLQSQKQIVQFFDKMYILNKKQQQKWKNSKTPNFSTSNLDRKQHITTSKLCDLKLITIKDLKVGKTHVGKYLKVRFIRDTFKMAAVQGLVQDMDQSDPGICGISIYNFPFDKRYYGDVFKTDIIIYIKQPYYKCGVNGFPTIRIDDPKDIQFKSDVENTSFLMKDINSIKHKKQGNRLFSDENYIDAISQYDKAIVSETSQQALSVLYSNKSIAFLNLNCGTDALQSAQKSLKYNQKNIKAVYLKIMSLILLDKFVEADQLIKQNQSKLPKAEYQKLINRRNIKQKWKNGSITWMQLFDSIFRKNQVEQYFSKKLEIRKRQKDNQLGIFSKQDILPCQILIVQKPIVYVKEDSGSNEGQTNFYQLDFYGGRIQKSQSNIQLRNKCQKLFALSFQTRNRLLSLKDTNSLELSIQQRQKINVKASTLKQKIDFNIVSRANIFKTEDAFCYDFLAQKISFINHSCTPNSNILLLNKTVVAHSIHPLKKGDQVFIRYTDNPEVLNSSKQWGKLCSVDKCISCSQFRDFSQTITNKSIKILIKKIQTFRTPEFRIKAFEKLIMNQNKQIMKKYRDQILRIFSVDQILVLLKICEYFGSSDLYEIVSLLARDRLGSSKVIKHIVTPQTFKKLEKYCKD